MGFLITITLRLLLNVHHLISIRLEKPMVMYDELVVTVLKVANENIPKILLDLANAICVDFICDVLRNIAEIEENNYPNHYILIFFPLFMLINLSEDLKGMILNSMIGNILILNATIIGLVYSYQSDNGSVNWLILNKELFYYPRFFGIVFCGLSSPGLILAIEHSTRKIWNYNELYGILKQCMTIIVCIHIIVGIVGYVKWGSNVSENFIHNIQKEGDGYILIAFITQALAIYFTYGLLSYVPINIVLKRYIIPIIEIKIQKGTPHLWELITRFVITLLTCILPKFIPRLRLQIAFIGLTCNFTLTVIIPLILYTILYIEESEEIERYNKKVLTLVVVPVM
ncbi:proton-coupled amino acid transporter 2-like [Vespa crabro]|uniref:proton-coupled amino acid transporter 2-like n=1 Tax=Vespa crabro TaxID=7445 RepID=UPI001F026E30|nr:proton-coupled amino acid transporter 2-like [Vespa crabro]